MTRNPFIPLLGSRLRDAVHQRYCVINDAHGDRVWLKDEQSGVMQCESVTGLAAKMKLGQMSLDNPVLRPNLLPEHGGVLIVMLLSQLATTPQIINQEAN